MSLSLTFSSGAMFALAWFILGVTVTFLAVRWNRWALRRAIIKGIVEMLQQEQAVRELRGE
jgi:hypothetical protein